MTPLETLIAPLLRSPELVEVLEHLNHRMAEERARRQRFYQEMTPEQKIEFIDGEVILHSPARNRHSGATSRLSRLLSVYVDLRQMGIVNVEKCLCVFPRNDYEPDIVFFGKEKAAALRPDTLKFPVPDLVVEVLSDSTAERDRGVKFADYAAHGVREYWIIDAEAEVLEQYLAMRSDDGVKYELRIKAGTGKVTSEVVKGFSIPIRAIFDEAENLAALRSLMAVA